MTHTVEVVLLGHCVHVEYTLHDLGYIEWSLVKHTGNVQYAIYTNALGLLETLLRLKYTGYIEGVIREHLHYEDIRKAKGFPPDDEGDPF